MSRLKAALPPIMACRDYTIAVCSDDAIRVEFIDDAVQVFTAAELDRYIKDLQRAQVDAFRLA
jgi:hypothetical protein